MCTHKSRRQYSGKIPVFNKKKIFLMKKRDDWEKDKIPSVHDA